MSKKEIKPIPVNNFEETLLWGSCRYFIGRKTIASACHAPDIMTNMYHRLTDNQKQKIGKDILREVEDSKRWNKEVIDDCYLYRWEKLGKALDVDTHYSCELTDGSIEICFDVLDKCIPLKKYIEQPDRDWHVPPENIKQKLIKDAQH